MGKFLSLPILAIISIYRVLISPIFVFFGVRCRHEPSCSSYSKEAIESHGPWYGGWMTLARLLRCQPWGTSGVDNVPENITTPPRYAPWRVAKWRGTNSE
ncbi:MAG: membrane protein insertion efficiency factor YidD [Litorimonas sp.]